MPDGNKLAEFVVPAAHHRRRKRSGANLSDRLFQAFGQPGCLDVGGHTEFRIRKASEDGGGTAFADYVWKPVVLIEMKKRGTDLQKHYRQAFDNWTRLVPNRPRYVVQCNFDEFRVYDFDTDLDTPKDTLALKDLPSRWGPLEFLAPGNPRPTFENDREKVTRAAADCLANVSASSSSAVCRAKPRSASSCKCSWRCLPRTLICCRNISSRKFWRTAPRRPAPMI
jgi:hypothetical protein